MRAGKTVAVFFIVLATTLCCCIDSYNPSIISGDVNFLVVEAFLNATENTCSVKLSRTVPLNGTGIEYEMNATVVLEDDAGNHIQLQAESNGAYLIENLTVDINALYTLKITTQDGEQYESDAVKVYRAGTIDSLTWHETRNGLAVDVNAHSNAGTGYYYWTFSETWVYHTPFNSALIQEGDTVRYRNQNEGIYRCFMSQGSNTISIGSSHKLAEDIIQNQNITTVPWTSPKISSRYSILVEQRTLDVQAYEYWQQLKKNTEELGTIFDPLPFLPLSNIHCTTSSDKIALGYFNASETSQQRIFVSRNKIETPNNIFPITGYEGCAYIVKLFGEPFDGYLPIEFEMAGSGFPMPIGYKVAVPKCVDCRMLGGTTIQPVFWE